LTRFLMMFMNEPKCIRTFGMENHRGTMERDGRGSEAGSGGDAAGERRDGRGNARDHLAAAMANEFENTRSMIEFSHHELDVRVRSLEEKRPAGSR
jgi:hypothetical protein